MLDGDGALLKDRKTSLGNAVFTDDLLYAPNKNTKGSEASIVLLSTRSTAAKSVMLLERCFRAIVENCSSPQARSERRYSIAGRASSLYIERGKVSVRNVRP